MSVNTRAYTSCVFCISGFGAHFPQCLCFLSCMHFILRGHWTEKVRPQTPNIKPVHTLHSHSNAFHVSWLTCSGAGKAAPGIIKVHQSALVELSLTANEAVLHQVCEGHTKASWWKWNIKTCRIKLYCFHGQIISGSAWWIFSILFENKEYITSRTSEMQHAWRTPEWSVM